MKGNTVSVQETASCAAFTQCAWTDSRYPGIFQSENVVYAVTIIIFAVSTPNTVCERLNIANLCIPTCHIRMVCVQCVCAAQREERTFLVVQPLFCEGASGRRHRLNAN